ncbi:prolipoprotein diacylglyceryl transferase [Candidatus Woesearchaeota archaeon]|nr:prolipoprotein diacylglyceryl transferase [Candidatus Woesearchaeota archaeon]
MLTHNIDPALLSFGPLEIRFYGVVYVLGVLAVYFTLKHFSKELKIKKDDADNITLYLTLGLIIGARLFEVIIWNPGYYFSDPIKILMIWRGGMSFHGGLIGILAAGYYIMKRYDLNIAVLADIIIMPLAFVLALGRIANFINAEIIGTITDIPWCVNFGDNVCRHPVQLYGAFGRTMLGIFLVLLYSYRKLKPGFLFWIFTLLMGIGRFFTDFLRDDPRFLYLSTGQYLSMMMIFISIFVIFRYYKEVLR